MTFSSTYSDQDLPSPSTSPLDKKVVTLESSDKVTYHLFAYQCQASRLIQDAIDNDEEEDIDIDIDLDHHTNQSYTHDNGSCGDINVDINVGVAGCNPPGTMVPLANVRSDCLAHVIRFMKHHTIEPLHPIQLHPHPTNSSGPSTTNPSMMSESAIDSIVTQEWYRSFIKELPNEMVFQIVNAANYMDIPSLLNLSCLKVSVDLMDKSAEDIRKVLNLPKMNEEEERRARDEHSWIFEGH